MNVSDFNPNFGGIINPNPGTNTQPSSQNRNQVFFIV